MKAGVFRALGVPVTEHSHEDGEILSHVIGLGLPPSATLVNVHLLFRKLGYVLRLELSREVLFPGCESLEMPSLVTVD